jgi:SAM-dependent methyltransferase
MSSLVAGQLAHPRGWLGRVVMTRALNRGNQQLIRATLDRLALTPETRLLDVGFGGGLSLELAAHRGVRRLAGVDPSEAAVRRLQARPSRHLKTVELLAVQGSVEALPFETAAFDAVISTNTVYFWPDLARAFSEMKRVLGSGGQLAIGFSSSQKLRSLDFITRHGFVFHESSALAAEATRAGFVGVRLAELRGGDVDGDAVRLAST